MEFIALVEIRYRDKSWERFYTDEHLDLVLSKARQKGEVMFYHWKPIRQGGAR